MQSESSSTGNEHRRRSSLESLFCYDKPIPEERIEKPIGLSLSEKVIGDNPRCTECKAKGAVLCATCSGSGLYVDSILESQGIIVKVRCLGKVLPSDSSMHVYLVGSYALYNLLSLLNWLSWPVFFIQFYEKSFGLNLYYQKSFSTYTSTCLAYNVYNL